jgi:hypothetical protein
VGLIDKIVRKLKVPRRVHVSIWRTFAANFLVNKVLRPVPLAVGFNQDREPQNAAA